MLSLLPEERSEKDIRFLEKKAIHTEIGEGMREDSRMVSPVDVERSHRLLQHRVHLLAVSNRHYLIIGPVDKKYRHRDLVNTVDVAKSEHSNCFLR